MHNELQPGETPRETAEDYRTFSEDFRIALDSTTQPIYIIDPETFEVLYCNEIVRTLSGCDPTGEPCYKGVRGRDHLCANCLALKLMRDGTSETQEYRTPEGKWVMARISPLRWKGRDLYKLICFDITERKKLEAQLQLRNQEYSALLQQSTLGIVRYEIATDTAVVNVDRNLNHVAEYAIPHYRKVLFEAGLFLPESLPAVRAVMRDIQNGLPGKEYDIHYQRTPEAACWLRVRYVLIGGEAGHPERAVLSFFDNTPQKEKELAYQNWTAQLNTMLNDRSVYLEVDLTADLVESESRPYDDTLLYKGFPFTVCVDLAIQEQIYEEDRERFRTFYDRARLLGLFSAGIRECSLEYRATYYEKFWWYRGEVRMAKDTATGHVKASLLLKDMDDEFRERDRLKEKAEHDSMTGVYNHATIEQLIREVLAQNTGEQCCFLVVDLDDLRAINSDLGHPEGDRALRAIADCMTEQFGNDDVIGRTGGDEFVALLRHVSGEAPLREQVFRFLDRLRAFHIGPNNDRPILVSVGGSLGMVGCDDFTTLYRQADLALYYTKAMGKNGFHLYRPSLEKREFTYQPRSKVSMSRNDWSEAAEFKRLINAVSAYYPLVISANLTQNFFHVLEYEHFTTQRAGENESYEQLIADGASTFHPEDQQSFRDCFDRTHLLRCYEAGQRIVEHQGRQLGDDGLYRLARTVGVMSQDSATGDICEVSFSHVSPL